MRSSCGERQRIAELIGHLARTLGSSPVSNVATWREAATELLAATRAQDTRQQRPWLREHGGWRWIPRLLVRRSTTDRAAAEPNAALRHNVRMGQ
jgi:hypothetical protein